MTEERATLHEAAHGYVAHRLGWLVAEIRVEQIDGRFTGHTIASPLELGDEVQVAEEGLRYVSAGIIAEAIYLGTRPRDALRESIRQGARDGGEMVEHLRTLAEGSGSSPILDVVADEVEELLRANWVEIQRIARVLAKDGVCHLRAVDG